MAYKKGSLAWNADRAICASQGIKKRKRRGKKGRGFHDMQSSSNPDSYRDYLRGRMRD